MGNNEKPEPFEATKRQLELLAMPAIAGIFPYRFDDTGFEMKSMNFTCGHCDKAIPIEEVRGNVTNLVKTILDMDLMVKCPACEVVKPFKIRVHSDRSCIRQNSDGSWDEFMAYSPVFQGVKELFIDMLKAVKCRLFGA